MNDDEATSPANGRSHKRRKVATEMPRMVELTSTRWMHKQNARIYNRIPTSSGENVSQVHILNTNKQFSSVQLLNRGCRRYLLKDPEDPLTSKSYYVGIDGADFHPMFIQGCGNQPNVMGNHNRGASFVLGKVKKSRNLLIPPCDMLRSGQMTFLKRQTRSNDPVPRVGYDSQESLSEKLREYKTQQTMNFCNGFACSVLVQDSDLKLDYNALPHTAPESWALFRMKMPKIAGKVVPPALLNELTSFLAKYPKDMVDLTFSLSMAILWCRLASAPGHQPELCVIQPNSFLSEGLASHLVPLPSLAVFLLYSSHFFRFHEQHGLAAYGHIFRYVTAMYSNDVKLNSVFWINNNHIDEEKVTQLVALIKLEEGDWMEVVPPSWEGSRLTMPRNSGCRVTRSEATTAWLMLPDIHTIGLPFYGNEMRDGLGDVYRRVFVHNSWMTPAILAGNYLIHEARDDTYFRAKDIELPMFSERTRLWSAPSTAVRGLWRETVSPVDGRLGQSPTNFSTPDGILGLPEPRQSAIPDASGILSPVKKFAQKLVVQFRLAQEEGFISPELQLGDSGLTWDGMQEHLKSTEKLPDGIGITEMVTKDATRQADLFSGKECTILRRLLNDMNNEANLPSCIRPFKQAIDPFAEDYSKSEIVPLMEEMGKPVVIQMNQIAAYIDQHDKEEDAFAKHIIKSCCFLLGIDYPGRPAEGHRAIFQVDSEVAMAVGDIMHENMSPISGNLPNAIRQLKHSSKFMPVWRFLMFRDRLMGENFDETRESVWEMAFGEPYNRLQSVESRWRGSGPPENNSEESGSHRWGNWSPEPVNWAAIGYDRW